MGEVYAPRTIAGRRSGLRHWAHFACNLMGWDLLLFQQPVEQSVDSILTAETKIMCFARGTSCATTSPRRRSSTATMCSQHTLHGSGLLLSRWVRCFSDFHCCTDG